MDSVLQIAVSYWELLGGACGCRPGGRDKRHFAVAGLLERLVDPRGMTLSLAVIASTLVVAAEGIALW
ncbi:MAG TPA: hypothetical protein VGB74_01745 [Actinoplanes sp.]